MSVTRAEKGTPLSRVAVITGAAGGIGSVIWSRFVEHGWDVVPVDRRPLTGEAALQVDVTQSEVVFETLSRLPKVDALVTCAGIQLYKPLMETTPSEWDEVLAANLRAPFVCLKAVQRQLAAADGAVVNISSVHALATSHSIAAYAASKGGLAAFTRAAAIEMAPAGVRVNAILPGAIDTPALRAGFDRAGGERFLVDRTPVGRIGSPHDVAEAAEFLADGDRSGYVTGTCLVVDGGALARLGTE